MKRVEKVIDKILSRKDYPGEIKEALNRIQAESQRRRRLYEAILSNTPDLAFIVDLNHRFIYANDSLLELWDMTWDEAIGKTLMENVTNKSEGGELDRKIDQVIFTKKPARGEILALTETPRFFDYIMVPVFRENGEVEAVAGTSRDITDRKEVEELLKKELDDMHRLQKVSTKFSREGNIEKLFDEILHAAVTIMEADKGNLQMLVQGTNQLHIKSHQGFSQLYLDYFTNIKPTVKTCCGEALKKEQRLIVADIEKSGIFSGESKQILLDADIRAVQSTPLITRSGETLGMISTHWNHVHKPSDRQLGLLDLLARQAADLIEQRQSEKALRESRKQLKATNETLEKRVAERTAELEKKATQLRNMTAELTSAEHRERKRLASILHDDLQQLLIAAKMHVGPGNGSDGLADKSEKVMRLLDQAVEVARDLTQQLRPPVLYESGLVSALDWLSSEMEERHHLKVKITAESRNPLLNDDIRVLLFQCIRELLFNVVKYAGVNEAEVRVQKNDDGWLRVAVKDEGKGFDTDTINKENPTRGYGLFSISERMAAAGGSMQIRSRIGEGTTVEMKIPTARGEKYRRPKDYFPALNTPGKIPTAVSDDDRISVLIVDDHAIVRRGIANALLNDKRIVMVDEAGDGREAVKMLKQRTSDVILMDMNMPRMNGVEASREIHRRWTEIPIIGMSVQEDKATEKSMLDAGAGAFLPKSGDFDELIEEIVRIAGKTGPDI